MQHAYCTVMGECVCVCVQVAVPQADMEEILPAARLLSRATAVTPSDYERAKTLFLAGLHNAGVQAQVPPFPPLSTLPPPPHPPLSPLQCHVQPATQGCIHVT